MNEPLSRYNITVTVRCDGGYRRDPAAFTATADQAAWARSASIISAHLADKIISVVTVTAPDRYAAVAVTRAVVSDALKRQALSSKRSSIVKVTGA
jgi:rhamnogalacturonyl hydrolase YesR